MIFIFPTVFIYSLLFITHVLRPRRRGCWKLWNNVKKPRRPPQLAMVVTETIALWVATTTQIQLRWRMKMCDWETESRRSWTRWVSNCVFYFVSSFFVLFVWFLKRFSLNHNISPILFLNSSADRRTVESEWGFDWKAQGKHGAGAHSQVHIYFTHFVHILCLFYHTNCTYYVHSSKRAAQINHTVSNITAEQPHHQSYHHLPSIGAAAGKLDCYHVILLCPYQYDVPSVTAVPSI